jgi:hypothetical protein
VREVEARGGVTVISKDQTASGDLGVYDLKKKTITLTGNVTVAQGKNVLLWSIRSPAMLTSIPPMRRHLVMSAR